MYTPSAADLIARAHLRAALTIALCQAVQRALTAINR